MKYGTSQLRSVGASCSRFHILFPVFQALHGRLTAALPFSISSLRLASSFKVTGRFVTRRGRSSSDLAPRWLVLTATEEILKTNMWTRI